MIRPTCKERLVQWPPAHNGRRAPVPIQTLEPILAEHPFLKGLRHEHVQLLIGCASNVKFAADDFIFREGEEANHFYILRDGKVSIEIPAGHRHGIIIETIEAGDVLGWSWVVAPYRWRFDARVVETTRAIALDAKCLRGKCVQDHELGFELLNRVLQVIEQRLHSTRMQLLDIYGGEE
jgi:CRP/FNR family cyclic AMP-dependent transcriptional regulator